MSDSPDSIEALATVCGLESEYYDYRGEHRLIPAATRSRILTAMGFDVSSEDKAAAGVARLEAEAWRSLLPPVAVVPAAGHGAVSLSLPERFADGVIHWCIDREDGSRQQGEVAVAALSPVRRRVVDGESLVRYEAGLPGDLPPGYHSLGVRAEQAGRTIEAATRLIAVPPDCHVPAVTESGGRLWGLAVQLYTLRSANNWGIGDFTDLGRLAQVAARHGVDLLGVNPLHALYPANPAHSSPYSPSSRTALNVLYIDVTAVPGYRDCGAVRDLVAGDAFQAALSRARAAAMVDYESVAQLKFGALRLLFQHFIDTESVRESDHGRRFAEFVRAGGAELELHATYDALHAHFLSVDAAAYGFRDWPAPYRDPRSEAVTAFALDHRQAIDYYLYLQWLADEQLAAAHAAALDAGMRIGIYRDLAVGVDSGGADAWGNQDMYCAGASVGAPPDPMALQGQDWGLPPMDPRRLRQSGYRAFTSLLRANFRHCGALRIDHVMALLRLWWLPRGGSANDGVYVYYPFDDLLGLLKLESRRSGCLVVGEDLGTVPDAIREALPAARVLSYRVMIFEKHGDGSMKRPQEYPFGAMATVTTHDLPTVYSYWEGGDIPLRDRLALFPNELIRGETVAQRAADRAAILAALASQDLLPADIDASRPQDQPMTPALAEAIQVYLARSSAALMVTQPEDWIAERRPVNLPGTSSEHPNWQRKLTVDIEELFADADIVRLCARLSAARAGPVDGAGP